MADSLHNALTNHATNGALHELHLPGYSAANVAAMNAISTGSAGDLCYVQSSGSYYARSAGGVWQALGSGGAGADGWTPDSNIWLYASADAPTFVANVNADLTSTIGVGMKVKLNQTTSKYFVVTAVGAYSSGSTPLTLYGGTDYTLANAAITLPYYSIARAPLGFPVDPAKWTVEVTDTTQRSQSSPVNGTKYNLGSVSISAPIGSWIVSGRVMVEVDRVAAGYLYTMATLSTANNTESDNAWSSQAGTYSVGDFSAMFSFSGSLNIASKTTYYLNSAATVAGVGNLYNRNDLCKAILRLTSAYL